MKWMDVLILPLSVLAGWWMKAAGYSWVWAVLVCAGMGQLLMWLYVFVLLWWLYTLPQRPQAVALAETRLVGLKHFDALQADLDALGYRFCTVFRMGGSFDGEAACWFHERERILAVAQGNRLSKRPEYRLIRYFDDGHPISMNAVFAPVPEVFWEPGGETYLFFNFPPPALLHKALLQQSGGRSSEQFWLADEAAVLASEARDVRLLVERLAEQGMLRPVQADGRQRLNLRGVWTVFRHQVFPFSLPATFRSDDKSRPVLERAARP